MNQEKTFKYKRRPEKEMIFGIRAVLEALKSGKEIEKILLRRDMTNELSRELMAAVRDKSIPVQKVPVDKLNLITSKNHQGVIAFISPVQFQLLEDIVPSIYEQGKNPLIVVLDGVTDVRNFGAVARTAECAGVDAIVVPSHGGASINADAVKTSAGALLKIPVCRVENVKKALNFLADSGLKLIAATEKSDKVYTEIFYNDPVALVLGSEEDGIAPEHLKLCHETVKIPLVGSIQSLNVSVAAGIMMFEVIRQRGSSAVLR